MLVVEILFAVIGQAAFEGAVAGALTVHEKITDKRNIKKKKKALRKGRIDDLEMWEKSLTEAIAAKAKGTEVPDKAIEHIRLHTATANIILHEAQRSALRLYVRKNKNHEDYNEELAAIVVQHVTVQSPATVAQRLNVLGDIFRHRTSDEEYREALIRSVVSYSIHKTKVLEPKAIEGTSSKPNEIKP